MAQDEHRIARQGALMEEIEDEGEDLTIMLRKERKGNHTAKGRKSRERKMVPASDKKAMRRPAIRTKQLNARVDEDFYFWLEKVRADVGESQATYLMQACKMRHAIEEKQQC